ncbi:hypothetical protein Q8F55_002593 [Vanrija albida]|uniref:Amine oxidase domain-containing protein n=1 Tax=Vanrija albida TaxID=181172 RepID=A0ABR3QA81_9TREE
MRVAVVGTGVSGLSVVWILKKYSDHEVNAYERNAAPGPATLELSPDGKEVVKLDAYPLGVGVADAQARAFLADAGVPLAPAATSFSATRDGAPLPPAWPLTLADALSPRAWRLALDVARWELAGDDGADASGTILSYLAARGYSSAFWDDYLLPRVAGAFLAPTAAAAALLPAGEVLARLASARGPRLASARGPRLALSGAALTSAVSPVLPAYNLHTGARIAAISSHEHGVTLTEESGQRHGYDHVVLALPGAQALALLQAGGWASDAERRALSGTTAPGVARYAQVQGTHVDAWTTPPAYGGTHTGVALAPSFALRRGVALTLNPEDEGPPALARTLVSVPPVGAAAALAAVQNARRISYVGAHAHDVASALASAAAVLSDAPFRAAVPYPAAPALSPSATLTLRALRLAVALADAARRAAAPLFLVLGWPAALALAVVGRVAALLGLDSLHAAASKLRAEWA